MSDVRINRFLASAGLGSRRKVEDLVRQGRVTINGQTVSDLSSRVNPDRDCVRVGGRTVKVARRVVYLVLNKPIDTLTTSNDPKGRRTVYDLLAGAPQPIFPVGRLDRMSEGLIIFTNDGQLSHRLAHPRYGIPRIYRLHLTRSIDSLLLARFRRGVRVKGELIRPKQVDLIHSGPKSSTLEVVLLEGKNREIRRICEALDLRIAKLKRISFGAVNLRGLPIGTWRMLRESEVDSLRKQVGLGVS